MSNKILYKDECYQIIGACFEVYNEKGNGFLEAVYQECLSKELEYQNISYTEKPKIELYYKQEKLNQCYQPDFLIYKKIIVELKTVRNLIDEHRAQVFNYLKSTKLRLGLIVNFGKYPKLEHERIVL